MKIQRKVRVKRMRRENVKSKIMNKKMKSISIIKIWLTKILTKKTKIKMNLMRIIMIKWLIRMIKMIWIRVHKKNHLLLYKNRKKLVVVKLLGQQKTLLLYLWNFLILLRVLILVNIKMNLKDMIPLTLLKQCLTEKKEKFLDLF